MQDKIQLFIERYIIPKVGEKTLEDIRLKRARTKISKAVIETLEELDLLKEMSTVEIDQLTHNIMNYKALKELKKKKPKYDFPEVDMLDGFPSGENAEDDVEALENEEEVPGGPENDNIKESEANPIEVEFEEEDEEKDDSKK